MRQRTAVALIRMENADPRVEAVSLKSNGRLRLEDRVCVVDHRVEWSRGLPRALEAGRGRRAGAGRAPMLRDRFAPARGELHRQAGEGLPVPAARHGLLGT